MVASKYPITITVRCCNCGCFVEARFDTRDEMRAKDRVYCGQPCFSRKARVQPKIIRVYTDRVVRVPNSEYEEALRKHRGLREEI